VQTYLAALNERQREAVLHTEGPLLIIAGAGAGKTRTITHRMAHLMEVGVPGRAILGLTFTNKAAGEMRERIRALLPHAPSLPLLITFHSLGVQILREFSKEAGLPRHFSIWDRADSERALKSVLDASGARTMSPRLAMAQISRLKGEGVAASAYAESADVRALTLARVWSAYEERLHSSSALDFDDLLVRTLRLLRDSPRVLHLLRSRWTHITIDEYQDTNAVQYEIARLLALPRAHLCVVGDIDQNIYSWRGADIAHLLSFEQSFPGTKTVLLEQNYRSTRTILSAANSVITKNTRRLPKHLFTANETGGPLTLYTAENELDEAWFVVQNAGLLIEGGVRPAEIAVLYRDNFQSRALEEAFLHFGIPYRVLGTRFFERAEVKDALSYVRYALNPGSADLLRIIGSPSRGIGPATAQKMLDGAEQSLTPTLRVKVRAWRETVARIAHALATLPVSEALAYTLEESGLAASFEKRGDLGAERLENVRELVNLAARYDDREPPEGAEALLEEATLASEQDALDLPARAGARADAVSLMTIHASKGLEFDAVFVTGLEQGLFPSERAEERDAEEERRLFYVALTRARKHLFLTHASTRMRYGERAKTLPSEFLDDIDPRLIARAGYPAREEEGIIR
jgi:DNA helicase-2/ATP-dependent DNA helicase PcrA